MEAFQLRLWDGRIGRWLSIDPAGEFHCPYLGMGNNPVNAIDPDGGDIIYLNDSKGVPLFGHAAVLIGNDKTGWRYLSMNGTGEGRRAYGDSMNADKGNATSSWDAKKGKWLGNDFRGTSLTAKQVMKAVNTSNINESHNYDRAIRIRTSGFEDEIAYMAAYKQASAKKYNIFGSSCIDVPQAALAAVVASRLGAGQDIVFHKKDLSWFQNESYGFHTLAPNTWFDLFEMNTMNPINFNLGNNSFEYGNVLDPRFF